MELEQKAPNKPNFFLIVLLSGGVILVILLIALAVIWFDGKRLPHFHSTHTGSSKMVIPGGPLPDRDHFPAV